MGDCLETPLWLLLGKQFCGQYYEIYDVVIAPLYRSKEVSVEGIYRNLLNSVWQHKYDVVNFIIQASGPHLLTLLLVNRVGVYLRRTTKTSRDKMVLST